MAIRPLVERPLIERTLSAGYQHLQSRARDIPPLIQAQDFEVLVGMKRQHLAPVDVFASSAPRYSFDQDHAIGFQELLEVIGDM
jgi:hypothetical protein